MASVPTVPGFTTGETPSITKLNQLASCVTFISVLPAFGQFTNSGQSITTASYTAVQWAKTTDRDGGWASGSNTRYTAQTPGYYQLDAVLTVAGNSGNRGAYFQVTTGSNNPGGAGNTTIFGMAEGIAPGAGSSGLTISQLSPYLYVLDYLQVFIYQSNGTSQTTGGCNWQVTLESLGP